MLLMVEKGARGGICIYNKNIDIQQLIINTQKVMIKIINRHVFNIRTTKNCNEESVKDIFLNLIFKNLNYRLFQ